MVSIPRSEFWSFGPIARPGGSGLLGGFNSSVGILVVRTTAFVDLKGGTEAVSIPRSEFWSFGLPVLHDSP